MNIGITCYSTYGGSGIVGSELARELARRGHRVHIIARALPTRLTELSDVIQFHGSESAEWLAVLKQAGAKEIWKAIGVKDASSLENAKRFKGAADRLLYDAPAQKLPGGQGLAVDWSLFQGFQHEIPWGLAGGLTPDNVAEAIRVTGAPLVDCSSGVETAPGVKDVDKIAAFCQAARGT